MLHWHHWVRIKSQDAVFPLNQNPNIVGHHLSFNVHWKQVATHLRKETALWRIWQAQPEDNKIKPFWWHTRQPVDRSQMTRSLSKVTSPAVSHDNYIHHLFLIQKQSFYEMIECYTRLVTVSVQKHTFLSLLWDLQKST